MKYIEEDVFDPNGLHILANYNNGKSEEIACNDSTKDDFTFSVNRVMKLHGMPTLTLDVTEVMISYRGATTSQRVEVQKKEVTSIRVQTPPTKLDYQEGEEFNPEGLILEVTYNNGSKEKVVYKESNKGLFGFDKTELQVEDTSITIKYGEKTVEQEIRVIASNPEISVLEQTSEVDKEKNPNTGDNMEIGKYCLIGGIGLLVIVGSVKRRKDN